MRLVDAFARRLRPCLGRSLGAWSVLFAAAVSTGCGARSGLDVPPTPPSSSRPSYCTSMAATPIYVVTIEGGLFTFDPPSKTFSSVGPLGCQFPGAAYSMAVEHDGTAFASSRPRPRCSG